jgi:protease secretion system membrane fusion protein
MPSKPSPGLDAVDLNDARARRWGWWLLLLGLAGFLGWALWTPLDAGVSAPGVVVVSGNRKAVQPVVAGRVAAFQVKDGDPVRQGQLLVKLDDTQSRFQLQMARGQWLSGLATQARLQAERSGMAAVVFPEPLLESKGDPRASSAMALQAQLFATRRQALRSELQAMEENIQGLSQQMRGVEEATRSRQMQARLLGDELKNQRELAEGGFLARNRVSEQERLLASLSAAMAEDSGTVGRIRQSVAEIRVRMAGRGQEVRREVETLLNDVQKENASLQTRIEALAFDVANAEIKAPADGVVMASTVHTVGGVVAVGSTLMEIVPQTERLRIEAQIAPHLIDKVRPGLDVDVLFSAFDQATTPHVPGKVLQVSADTLTEPRQNLPYFKATVEVTADGMAGLKRYQIRAGMPVEVFVRTGERTPMNYLLKPLRDRMNRALIEP